MRTMISTLILLTISSFLLAQEFEIPPNYQLVEAEDYAPYEQDVINCVEWLTKTPLNEQPDKRKEANAFLIKWLMGSPYVHLEINSNIITFMESSPDLLMIFMGGWAKYALKSRDFDNKVMGNKAGIEAIVDFYNANRDSLPKDKNVEKYVKMKKKNSLEEYIKAHI